MYSGLHAVMMRHLKINLGFSPISPRQKGISPLFFPWQGRKAILLITQVSNVYVT